MNILFLNSARRGWGGNEKWLKMAAAGLQENHNVMLAYRDPDIGKRIPVRKFRLPFRHELDAATVARLMELIRTHRIDILVPTKQKEYVLAAIAARLTGSRCVFRLGITRKLDTPLKRLIYNRLADGIIVNARRIKSTLRASGLKDNVNVRVVYNGIDTENIAHLAQAAIPELPFDTLITAMGELSPRKGFDRLIDAFARLAHRGMNSSTGLVIIGEGNMKETLRKQAAALGIDSRIVLTGFLENPYPYLAASSIFVMPSANEGISNALLEAATLGNAIVTGTSGGGITEVIRNRENGLLVDAENPEDIAENISLLLDSPVLRRQIAGNGQKTVGELFSMKAMTHELTDFFSSIVNHPA